MRLVEWHNLRGNVGGWEGKWLRSPNDARQLQVCRKVQEQLVRRTLPTEIEARLIEL